MQPDSRKFFILVVLAIGVLVLALILAIVDDPDKQGTPVPVPEQYATYGTLEEQEQASPSTPSSGLSSEEIQLRLDQEQVDARPFGEYTEEVLLDIPNRQTGWQDEVTSY